jgi:hypothetical protein
MFDRPWTLLFSCACFGSCTFLMAGSAWAQKDAAIYRCQVGDKVEYSHNPCLGARVVDATPTRGLDKASGKSKKGADVTREERRELMADALKPLTGMDAQQLEKFGHRRKLAAEVQKECKRLDDELPQRERSVREAADARKGEAEAALFVSRNRFRSLRC